MQRIKLMTDSACDLPGSLARQLGIEVIPIPIAVDGKGYLEGVDFTPREFYTILQQAKQIPTTSQISPVTYCERYHAAYQQGYTDVILMGISSTASATYLRSKDAADLFRIHIIDSKTFSLGYGYPLTQAAQMIQDGKTAEEILAYLTDWVERIDLYITAFSFEFIKKSGRISCAASIVGEALGIRPVIRLYQGEITIFSKARGNNVVLQRIAQIAQDNIAKDSPLLMLDGTLPDMNEEMRALLQKKLNRKPDMVQDVGCAVSINSGPKMLGIGFLRQKG